MSANLFEACMSHSYDILRIRGRQKLLLLPRTTQPPGKMAAIYSLTLHPTRQRHLRLKAFDRTKWRNRSRRADPAFEGGKGWRRRLEWLMDFIGRPGASFVLLCYLYIVHSHSLLSISHSLPYLYACTICI